MVAYYLFIIVVAAVFYYFLVLNKVLFFDLRGFTFLFVFWILIVCALFPAIVSFVSPFFALMLTVVLAALGGYIIYILLTAYYKAQKKTPQLLLPAGRIGTQLLLSTVSAEPGQFVAVVAEQVIVIEPEQKVALEPVQATFTGLHVIQEIEQTAFTGAKQDDEQESRTVAAGESEQVVTSEPVQGKLPFSSKKTTFEELINSAFQAKEGKDLELAIDCFQKALADAGDASLKGMICTELVFLYRELGRYQDAAALLEGYIFKNSPFLSPALHSQLKQVVKYLQKTNELLIKMGQPNLPFTQVPQVVKLRAEQVLKE